jgi:archaellum biogenesis ATPase FlaH
MDDSATFAPRTLFGIESVDQSWGGLFEGGRYLTYGTNASGRSLLPAAFIAAATRSLQTSLLVSRLRSADLAIQATSLGFDFPQAVNSGLLRVSRTPFELELIDRDDDSLESSLKVLASLIVDATADRVVIDDFSAFARFSSFDRFRTAFARLITELEHIPSTILIGMPEPANDASRRIIDYMGTLMTGCLHVHLTCVDGFSQRTISLIPQIGHVTRRVDVGWQLEHVVARADDIAKSLQNLSGTSALPSVAAVPPVAPPPQAEAPIEDPTEETDLWVPTHQEPVIDMTASVDVTPDEPSSFEFSVEPAPPTPVDDAGLVFLNRERFTDELQLYFDDYETSGSSFTLVAMRTENPNDGTGSDDFRDIIQALQDVLQREDSLFADPIVERIIVILGDGKSDEAQNLFASVKNRLRETAPDKADHLLNVVAAVVVPDGKPFTTAKEFVRYVLDEGD